MFLRAGIGRVIDAAKTGRAWVQQLLVLGTIAVSVRNFFAALSSQRRLRLLTEIDEHVRQQANQRILDLGDPFAEMPELNGFDLYASDGHSHGASAHENELLEKKRATNHIFSLDLRYRTHAYFALTEPAEGKKKGT